MQRRQVLTGLLACTAAGLFPRSRQLTSPIEEAVAAIPYVDPVNDHENRVVLLPSQVPEKSLASLPDSSDENQVQQTDNTETTVTTVTSSTVKQAVLKSIDFAKDYEDDIFVTAQEERLLHAVTARLGRLQKTVGYGNFNIINFDDALIFAKRFSQIGAFTAAETAFIEKVFTFNAPDYGFYGNKVNESLTSSIKKSSVFKVPASGHYLFKDQSLAYYEKIRGNIGEGLILTSGVRSNVKHLHLFLAKAIRVKGNLSRASRSLAPPGYSYHGVGDFDVGRKGWGARNFTDDFAKTDEFKRMQDLGYIAIRYDHGNTLDVRFEPWHIKVA